MTIFLRKVYREVRGIDAIESVVESASCTSSPIALEHETPEIISKRSSLSAPGRITQLLLPMRLRSFFKRTQSKRSIEAAKTDGNGPSGLKASNATESMPASARRSSAHASRENRPHIASSQFTPHGRTDRTRTCHTHTHTHPHVPGHMCPPLRLEAPWPRAPLSTTSHAKHASSASTTLRTSPTGGRG